MSRILALILGIAGLLTGSYLPDLAVRSALPAPSPVSASAEASANAPAEAPAEPEALQMSLVHMEAVDADQVVYARGDAGVALRGAHVSAHVNGAPVSSANVKRMGNGVQVYDPSGLVAEVALRATPNGLAVDWIWAPQSYYAVTFPSLGIRVTGMRSDPGEESMDALRVTDVDPGSSAEASGLAAGSRIDAIVLPTSSAYQSSTSELSTYESPGEMPATPLALRQALAQARHTSVPIQLRIQQPETHDHSARRLVTVSTGNPPVQ